jgi:FkbM family methyltransferase
MTGSVRSGAFRLFKRVYRILAATPLRRVPGMLTLSNMFFRRAWPGGHVIEVQGIKMYIDVNDPNPNMRKTFQAYGMALVHEEETTALFRQIVKPGDVVLDLGANIGYFTVLAAKAIGPGGRVFSFEPEPTNFRYLTKNIEINGFDNVFAFQKAVSDSLGTTQLFVCDYDSGHHTINRYDGIRAYSRGRHSEVHSISIDTVTIDQFLDGKTDRVDVIKMDVEGAEALALHGMRDTLRRNAHVRFIVEFFPLLMKNMGSSPQAFAQSLLGDFGFTAYAIGREYAALDGDRNLVQIQSASQLMGLLGREDDHINLYLTRDVLKQQ